MKIPFISVQSLFVYTVENTAHVQDVEAGFGGEAKVIRRFLFAQRSEVRQIDEYRRDVPLAANLDDSAVSPSQNFVRVGMQPRPKFADRHVRSEACFFHDLSQVVVWNRGPAHDKFSEAIARSEAVRWMTDVK